MSSAVQPLESLGAAITKATPSRRHARSHAAARALSEPFPPSLNHTSSPGEVHNLNGYTLESTLNFNEKNYAYTRLELVDKNELLRSADRALLGITDDHPSFRIGAFTFGAARDLVNNEKLSFAIGSDLTFYSKPAVLDQIYGSHPVSWKLFLRIRPAKMSMASMHGH